MEKVDAAIQIKGLSKKFKGFALDIPELSVPKGFSTALIGENGAGKTTLLNILSGIRLDYQGDIKFFDRWSDKDREQTDCPVREMIGYTGPGSYFLPAWTVKQVEKVNALLFEHFHRDQYERYVDILQIANLGKGGKDKKVSDLSDGNKMKLMLAGVLARDTEMLLLDEPASSLDPLMRDVLCNLMREYIEQGEGEKTVFFSTHNIADMENVTDYAIIMEQGHVAEQGFVEDLKEKYVLVKGEAEDIPVAEKILYSITKNAYGYEGICLAEDMNKLAGLDTEVSTPSLSQISVAVMKKGSKIHLQ